MAQSSNCAHDGCHCKVDAPKAFVQDGRTYCSSGCASGQGCEHGSCNCGRDAGSAAI
jgi:hypothetical protein